jgi:hypothetical protein
MPFGKSISIGIVQIGNEINCRRREQNLKQMKERSTDFYAFRQPVRKRRRIGEEKRT